VLQHPFGPRKKNELTAALKEAVGRIKVSRGTGSAPLALADTWEISAATLNAHLFNAVKYTLPSHTLGFMEVALSRPSYPESFVNLSSTSGRAPHKFWVRSGPGVNTE